MGRSARRGITKVSVEQFVEIYAPVPSAKFTDMSGAHNYFHQKVMIGDALPSAMGTRLLVYADSYTVVFMVGEQMYSQLAAEFAQDINLDGIVSAGQRAAGTAKFAEILMGLFAAGFALTSAPAFWLVTLANVGESAAKLSQQTDFRALLRFATVFLSTRTVLKAHAPELYDQLYSKLLRRVGANLGEALDPEAVGKICIGIVAAVIRRQFDTPLKAAGVIFVTVAKSFLVVLSTLPEALILTEREVRSQAARFIHEFRKNGVSAENHERLVNYLMNPKVVSALAELRDAAQETALVDPDALH